MATKAKVEKWKRRPRFSTRYRNRCRICGRARGYIGKFAMCRMCFRARAHRGQLPGIKKASW